MSQELLPQQDPALAPKDVAGTIFLRIHELETDVKNSKGQVDEIENRSWLKSAFSSSRTDLVSISKSQNKINDAMLEVVSEAITLNVTSYSYMAAVIDQLNRYVANGMKDADGRIIKLSDVGHHFADSASAIFNKILEGSRGTQEALVENAKRIEQVDHALQETDARMQKQVGQLSSVQAAMEVQRAMDEKRAQQIAELRQADEAKANRIQGLADELAELSSRHGGLQQRHDAALGELEVANQRVRSALWVAAGSMVFGLAALVVVVGQLFKVL